MAKWSLIWKTHEGINRAERLKAAAFTSPSKPKKKLNGKYPHLQPFFRNRKAELKIAA